MYVQEVQTLDDAQVCGEEIVRSAWVTGFTLEQQVRAMRQLIDRVHEIAEAGR